MARDAILRRWREAMVSGDSLFTAEGIAAVERALVRFEADAAAAGGSPESLAESLRAVVLELDRLGGLDGIHGSFLETDEREELVPYLLGVVAEHGLHADGEDLTEPYRLW
jgi:hypothetical protein